ncbi:unnamed protein product [Porites lobata]|uniref:Major capsid protein n=1 Tax=Porites lobata TaxID=104759 RepID=A0ABN8QQN6_9CNID|nr:unnamed protein product [Porites lobata]
MNIEEYKKLARNKIEADALTKLACVRDVIKTTKWQKQDMREGFKETFKPLIKSQDSIKKSIDEQQNATIAQLKANQLALTQGLNQNRLVITEGFDKMDEVKKWDLTQLPGFESIEESKEDDVVLPSTSDEGPKIAKFKAEDLDRYLNSKDSQDILRINEYHKLPSEFFKEDVSTINKVIDDVNEDLKDLSARIKNTADFIRDANGYVLAQPKSKKPREETLDYIKNFNILSIYATNLSNLKYEDVVFDLEQALATPANAAHQTKTGHRFFADNTGEATPFDWYNARFSVDFKVNELAAGANIDADGDNNGIVNGSSSLIEKLSILANGRDVYSCNYANHIVNIKNLLEYNPSYVESVATNEFYYLDTSRNANRKKYSERQVQHGANDAGNGWEARNFLDGDNANYNKGFSIRKTLLGDSATVRCEIPLNRYSFFEALEDKLLPNTKIELNIELESDANLIWRTGGNNCRVILTRFQLFVPRMTFNSEGQKLYMENYLKPYKWVYLNEVVERSNNSQQQTGHFRITNAISKPRHVFVFGINTANIDSQTANPFLYNTFNLPNNANISRCYLEVGNGNEYPNIHFKPATDSARVFREVMGYVYANNDFQGGTLLNRTNFETLFPFVYFDLTKQKLDIKDGVTKLAFHYELSANPNADYNLYALILHERVAEIEQQGGKLLLRA